MEGFLLKKTDGIFRKKWIKKYFAVDSVGHCITVFADKPDHDPNNDDNQPAEHADNDNDNNDDNDQVPVEGNYSNFGFSEF
jgi:hypothetical protein